MPEDVVGTCRLLDPAEVEWLQVLHPLDRLTDVPHLVRVGHERKVPDLLSHQLAAPDIGRDVDADLGLEAPPPVGQCGARQVAHLRLGVPEPARRGEVRRIPVSLQLGDPRVLAARERAQPVQRFVAIEHVAQVAEVDERDQLLG